MNCKIVFANGNELDNLIFENGVFISKTEVTDDMLTDEATATVTIVPKYEGEDIVLRYAKHDMIYQVEDEWHFVLVGADASEIRMRELAEENELLTECILEMSEIIYGE